MPEKTIDNLTLRLLLRSVYLKGHQDGNNKTTDISWEDRIISDIRQLIKEELEEKSRELKNIYDKYSHLDQCLSDKFWCGESLQAQMQNEFWIAIKNSKTAIAEYLGEGKR